MRKLTSLVAALLLSVAAFAQAPQGFSYQAVVRDAQNAIVANQTVDVTLTLKAEIKSIPVQTYTEKHSVKTNANGLLTLVVGQGESSQKFSDFKWNLPEAIYNLETVTPYGTGTTQLLSVPYALYAEQAGNIDYAKLLSSLNVNDLSTILGLADYLKQADIQNLLATYALKTEIPTEVNLTAYAKTTDVDSIYAKKTDIPTAVNLSGYATKDTLNNFALKTSLASDYVTKETFENYVLTGGDANAVDLTVYATSAKLNDTLAAYAKTADLATVATTGSYNDLTNKPTIPAAPDLSAYAKTDDVPVKLSDLNADYIGDMPLATVNVTVTNVDDVATVSFLGRELKSGTTTFKVPAYSPVFLSVALSVYKKQITEGAISYTRFYSYKVKINGNDFDPVVGQIYYPVPQLKANFTDTENNKKMTWVGGINYDPLNPNITRDISTIDGMTQFITKDFHFSTGVRYDKVKIYKPGYQIYNPVNNGYYEGNSNMENQVVGPFPLETNTIEIIVTSSDSQS